MACQGKMITAAEHPKSDLGRGLWRLVERVTGIEPALSAWEADVLPLNYTRERHHSTQCRRCLHGPWSRVTARVGGLPKVHRHH
jgi:hypothetical protein